jgi:uncharacterized LabA/DUF88 family protein
MPDETHSLAVLIDFENVALGLIDRPNRRGGAARPRTAKAPANGDVFDIKRVLERLVEKGKLIVKVAYADWGRFGEYRNPMHDACVQMVEIPERGMTGKNYADIQLAVDAMDLCWSKEHIDTFVVVSGDSDFTPLVAKLKENGKTVIGLGLKDSTSDLLAANCDEFIYYDDLGKGPAAPVIPEVELPKSKRAAMDILINTIQALQRENKDVMYSSLVKDTIKRKQPSFNESGYGYRSFSDMLLDAEKLGLITLRIDQRSGTYVVVGFAEKK